MSSNHLFFFWSHPLISLISKASIPQDWKGNILILYPTYDIGLVHWLNQSRANSFSYLYEQFCSKSQLTFCCKLIHSLITWCKFLNDKHFVSIFHSTSCCVISTKWSILFQLHTMLMQWEVKFIIHYFRLLLCPLEGSKTGSWLHQKNPLGHQSWQLWTVLQQYRVLYSFQFWVRNYQSC